MKYVISGPSSPVQDTIYIPSSKSISNRMLILHALAGKEGTLGNLSESDDTRVIQEALSGKTAVIDIGHAGTAMRFLTAYFATRNHTVVLTGSDRMKERPVGPLVAALRELGAGIEYMGKTGFPPLRISGGLHRGGRITVDGGISSQFISALMMIGPLLEGGLEIVLTGNLVSATYIGMTLELMKSGRVEAEFTGREVLIRQGNYHFGDFIVEADWSGASYWYQVAALMPGSVIRLPHLYRESHQGDGVLESLFQPLGVNSRFDGEGVVLYPGIVTLSGQFSGDFTGCPDLVQTMAVTLCAMGFPFHLTGTRTLRLKETDRIAALQKELGKLGFAVVADAGGDWIRWDGNRVSYKPGPVFETYHDHRMAMAFAPLAIPFGSIGIADPMVVTKSYPGYWDDLGKAGFRIREHPGS
jgi:3-phosphoshikimate 1-carboxyvinyltransferase